jgi:hypothetical protein
MHSIKYNKIQIQNILHGKYQLLQVQHANSGADRPHCNHQNIKILKFQNTQS